MTLRLFIKGLLLVLSGISNAQNVDRINIYAIPVPTSFAVDNIDANYVRVNHTYKFESTDSKYIDSVYNFFFQNDFEHKEFDHRETSTTIRLVVDFIHREKIKSFVLMNSGNEFYIVKSPSVNSIKFQLIGKDLCAIKDVLPFYDWIEYSPLNCK